MTSFQSGFKFGKQEKVCWGYIWRICIGKLFLTDINTGLFLIASQQMWHEFCTDVMHLKFFSKHLMARSYDDAHFV
jgi:hypothetical protein